MLSENAVTSIHLRRRPREMLWLEVLSIVAKEDTVVMSEKSSKQPKIYKRHPFIACESSIHVIV